MIGGGIDSFVGGIHRRAIALDGRASLVAGALSSTPEKSLQSAKELGLDPDRSYATYQELFEREVLRDDRVDFVSIVTPNDTHYPIAKMALEQGFHVVLDKPATHTAAQAQELETLATEKELVCCVTYNYTGYPMIRQARAMIKDSVLGNIRKVFIEYHQGWLATDLASTGHKQASWRDDPARAGIGGALGDIGTHAENLSSFVTGLTMESVFANLHSFVSNRILDDDVSVMINYEGGAHGVLTASQVCVGEDNNLSIRVYGEKGGLRWNQESPDNLYVTLLDGNTIVYSRGGSNLHIDAVNSTTAPAGHPEGYLEAFSNIYRGVFDTIQGNNDSCLAQLMPTISAGVQGMKFVQKCVESARTKTQISWV